MDTLIPIISFVGAIALFIVAFLTYKKPNRANQILPTTSSQNKTNTTFWNRFFNFDEFVTTQILKAVYIVGTILITFAAFGSILLVMFGSRESRPVSEIVQSIFVAKHLRKSYQVF